METVGFWPPVQESQWHFPVRKNVNRARFLGSEYRLTDHERRIAEGLFPDITIELGYGGSDILDFIRSHPIFE